MKLYLKLRRLPFPWTQCLMQLLLTLWQAKDIKQRTITYHWMESYAAATALAQLAILYVETSLVKTLFSNVCFYEIKCDGWCWNIWKDSINEICPIYEKTSNNWNKLIILDYHKNPEENYPGQNCEYGRIKTSTTLMAKMIPHRGWWCIILPCDWTDVYDVIKFKCKWHPNWCLSSIFKEIQNDTLSQQFINYLDSQTSLSFFSYQSPWMSKTSLFIKKFPFSFKPYDSSFCPEANMTFSSSVNPFFYLLPFIMGKLDSGSFVYSLGYGVKESINNAKESFLLKRLTR